MKKLYKFHWDCGRMGNVEGLFIASIERVCRVIGQEVHFGEILGKHSEVYGVLEEKDLKIIDIQPESLEHLEHELGETLSGYNPIDVWEEQHWEELSEATQEKIENETST